MEQHIKTAKAEHIKEHQQKEQNAATLIAPDQAGKNKQQK